MPAPDSPVPEARTRRRPVFTIATWVVLALGSLVTYIIYQNAVTHRSSGDWLPGIGQLVFGSMVTAFITVCVGLAAFLRRERNSWLALLPFLGGLCLLLSFLWNYVSHMSH
jgi:hypothetical protein